MKNNNAVAVFISGSKISCDENGLYSLNDLHKASGGEKRHRPNYWLNLESTKEVLEEISKKTDAVITATKRGGKDQGTFVNDILLSMYASWISPRMHIRVYEIFTQTIKERSAALENENKKLTNFKDDIYRRESINSHLSKDYSQFDKDVIKSIKAMLKRLKWQKEVPFRDFAYSSNYGRSEVFLEAWGYMERNVVECINDTTDRDKQIFAIKSIL